MTHPTPNGRAADRPFFQQAQELLRSDRYARLDAFAQHGNTSCLLHSVAVAYYSYRAGRALPVPLRERALIRGALLHDYFLYDWHDPDPSHRLHGFRHPRTALRNAARDFPLDAVEREIIRHHMFPLTPAPPRCREALLVCLVDKACSLYEVFRPDAYPTLRRRLPAVPAISEPGGTHTN